MKMIVVGISLLFTISQALAGDEVILATGEFPPFTSSESKDDRIAQMIVKEAFAAENINVVIKYVPWSRAYEGVKSGSFHGTFPWAKTEERLNDSLLYSDIPVIETSEVFFSLKSIGFEWSKLSDLGKYTMGGTRGYSHVVDMENSSLKVHVASSPEQNFKKLLSGRIDAFPESRLVGSSIMKKVLSTEEISKVTYHEKPRIVNPLYMMFSPNMPNSPQLSKSFDKGLSALKASGRYDEIINSGLNQ